MNKKYAEMSIEELVDEYYWAKQDLQRYEGGWFVFSYVKEENARMIQEKYDIMYKVIAEIESRIEKIKE